MTQGIPALDVIEPDATQPGRISLSASPRYGQGVGSAGATSRHASQAAALAVRDATVASWGSTAWALSRAKTAPNNDASRARRTAAMRAASKGAAFTALIRLSRVPSGTIHAGGRRFSSVASMTAVLLSTWCWSFCSAAAHASCAATRARLQATCSDGAEAGDIAEAVGEGVGAACTVRLPTTATPSAVTPMPKSFNAVFDMCSGLRRLGDVPSFRRHGLLLVRPCGPVFSRSAAL